MEEGAVGVGSVFGVLACVDGSCGSASVITSVESLSVALASVGSG